MTLSIRLSKPIFVIHWLLHISAKIPPYETITHELLRMTGRNKSSSALIHFCIPFVSYLLNEMTNYDMHWVNQHLRDTDIYFDSKSLWFFLNFHLDGCFQACSILLFFLHPLSILDLHLKHHILLQTEQVKDYMLPYTEGNCTLIHDILDVSSCLRPTRWPD